MQIKLSDIKQFEKLDFLASQLVEGFITGLHKSPYHGFSVEFAEHKLYNFGESTRHIDWKLYSRTDKLYTKQYEEETNLRCHILVDISGSMYYPQPDHNKIKFASLSAAAMALMLAKQRDAVSVSLFSEQITHQTSLSSTIANLQHIYRILDTAINEKKQIGTSTANVLHEIANTIHRRSLIILFTDMISGAENIDAVFESLLHLKHNNHEILLFHVTDHSTELHFEFEDRLHKFIDAETGETIKLNPRDVKRRFSADAKKRFEELKLKCGQYKIDLIEADSSAPFDKVLLSYLIKRKKMN